MDLQNGVPLTNIRKIPVDQLLDDAVDWTAMVIAREEAPGVIIGLSGTDSLVAAVVCLKAFEKLGMPTRNVRIVNFQHQTHDKFVEMNAPFVCTRAEDPLWVERALFPWLRERWPEARLEVDTSIVHSRDGARWGAIHDKAKEEVNGRGDMLSGTYYLPVGSRNATEQAMGGFTLITGAVSLMPIADIFKTEVLDICAHLGVPGIAMEKSREIDCDCGRFEIQAHHMDELDKRVMAERGLIPMARLEEDDPQIRHDVECFLREERLLNEFKDRTPYRPNQAPGMATGVRPS